MSNRLEAGSDKTIIRRRPTRRHRRNRLIRRGFLIVLAASLAFGFASIALQHLSPSLFRASNSDESERRTAEASRRLFLLAQQESLRQMENRPIFPYSIVPGGVQDARELKWAAQHDPVVAAHYAGFDYDRGRVVRLVLARTAYVSYRIGNKVYWTRHRLKLKKGETVVTDGKIIVRSRCGNRVEEAPQQATDSSEPPALKFDEPMLPALGIASSNPPVPFESALTQSGLPGFGPAMPLSLVDPFGNGTWVPITPPPLPGVCGIEKKPKNTAGTTTKGKLIPCAPGSISEVPEPGTWLLLASGLAAMCWMYWKSRRTLDVSS